jgi:hypothetical protein
VPLPHLYARAWHCQRTSASALKPGLKVLPCFSTSYNTRPRYESDNQLGPLCRQQLQTVCHRVVFALVLLTILIPSSSANPATIKNKFLVGYQGWWVLYPNLSTLSPIHHLGSIVTTMANLLGQVCPHVSLTLFNTPNPTRSSRSSWLDTLVHLPSP